MYSDAELDAAVKAGVLRPDDAAAFRTFVARLHAAPGADEERFRLLTGFNDIFVAIAAALVLLALGWLGGLASHPLGAALVAAASWGIAEYFTRRRRMALPSILLLLTFVGGVFLLCITLLGAADPALSETGRALRLAAGAAGAAVAAWLHWRRFMVPITVAAGVAATAGTVLALLAGALPVLRDLLPLGILLAGLVVFALAMRWDASDPERVTRRADVAFWLHLAAAPMIVHPAFHLLRQDRSVADAALAVSVYVVLAVVALAVDRRALLVSGLAYVLYSISALVRGEGSAGLSLALAALAIGCGLLLLSALWQQARRSTVRLLPEGLRRRLPAG